jgi:hypothetical protein
MYNKINGKDQRYRTCYSLRGIKTHRISLARKTIVVTSPGKTNFSRKTGAEVLFHIQWVNSTRRLWGEALTETDHNPSVILCTTVPTRESPSRGIAPCYCVSYRSDGRTRNHLWVLIGCLGISREVRHFRTRKLPITRASMPELKKVQMASVGVHTIASPRKLKDVFITTGTPVRFPNSSISRQ